jgi:hypothetical protein
LHLISYPLYISRRRDLPSEYVSRLLHIGSIHALSRDMRVCRCALPRILRLLSYRLHIGFGPVYFPPSETYCNTRKNPFIAQNYCFHRSRVQGRSPSTLPCRYLKRKKNGEESEVKREIDSSGRTMVFLYTGFIGRPRLVEAVKENMDSVLKIPLTESASFGQRTFNYRLRILETRQRFATDCAHLLTSRAD